MTKQVREALKNIPYYKGITRKYRYTNPVKDKAWGILSDYVRCRDFLKYGTCVSSGKRIIDWKATDAGHFYSMGGHGTAIGFYHLNIHAQSKNDNQLGSMHTGANYEKELVRRYGKKLLDELKVINQQTVEADDWYFIEKIKQIYSLFKELQSEHNGFDFPKYLDK